MERVALYTAVVSWAALLKRDMAVAILPDLRAWRAEGDKQMRQWNAVLEKSWGFRQSRRHHPCLSFRSLRYQRHEWLLGMGDKQDARMNVLSIVCDNSHRGKNS